MKRAIPKRLLDLWRSRWLWLDRRLALKKSDSLLQDAYGALCPWDQPSLAGALKRARDKAEFQDFSLILQDAYGMRFAVYPWDRPNISKLLNRAYDKAEFQAFARLVRKGDVVFDVGANAGTHSVYFSRLCGESGRVVAFEPVPDTYWRLREVLALNRCENVTPVEKAVYERVGAVRINLFEPRFSAWNSLGRPSMPADGIRYTPSDSLEVAAETLDHFCRAQQIEQINFFKVDVEGFEKSVFLGARRLLEERRVDYVCFEISQDPLKGAESSARDVFEVLAEHGYLSYRFDEPTGTFQGPVQDCSEYWVNFFASWRDLSQAGQAPAASGQRPA